MDWLNANGLVDGNIPPETQCPFWDDCGRRVANCPSHENGNLRPHDFSCALARLFSLVKTSEEKKHAQAQG